MTENIEPVDVVMYARQSARAERRILCPECENSRLPLDAVTECDNCGAHLELYVKTVAPALNNE